MIASLASQQTDSSNTEAGAEVADTGFKFPETNSAQAQAERDSGSTEENVFDFNFQISKSAEAAPETTTALINDAAMETAPIN